MPMTGRGRQNPAEEMLTKVWRDHPDWTDDQWFDYFLTEFYKPQEDNLLFAAVEYCIMDGLDHLQRYWRRDIR